MEGQRERTSSRRRQRRKSKSSRNKIVIEPVLIAARRPDSPLLRTAFRDVVASAQPKYGAGPGRGARAQLMEDRDSGVDVQSSAAQQLDEPDFGEAEAADEAHGEAREHRDSDPPPPAEATDLSNGSVQRNDAPRRRAVRIVKAAEQTTGPGNREQQLLERLMRSQGRGAISRAANDLWENKFVAPKKQEVQIQLLEHENEHRARDAVFAIAELLQREAPIQRPILDQRLRRLEQSAEDPITRDAAGALRRSMRVHYGAL